jgi:hypothetical protein
MTDQMQSEIAELSRKIDEIEDPRQCFAIVQERVRRYRSQGLEVPAELARLERSLAAECRSESQGR